MANIPRVPYHTLHLRPLPVSTHPLPAIIPHNPLSLLRLAYALLAPYFSNGWTSHEQIFHAYWSADTRSVHVTDPVAVRALWERGFFGKGSLSRSEPEWVERERARRRGLAGGSGGGGGGERRVGVGREKVTAGEVTRKRREERKKEKRERARKEAEELEEQLRKEGKIAAVGSETGDVEELLKGKEEKTLASLSNGEVVAGAEKTDFPEKTPDLIVESSTGEILENQEHLQLTPHEAFFLSYGLGCLTIHKHLSSLALLESQANSWYTNSQLLTLFTSNPCSLTNSATLAPDHPFFLTYVVYHHFRSLGWVVRSGVKFAVDFLLYARGPAFAHAEFAVLVLPSYSHPYWTQKDLTGKLKSRKADEARPWWWLHSANRVQNQVRKSLVLVFVEIPEPLYVGVEQEKMSSLEKTSETFDIGTFLKRYRVKEYIVSRWTANRQR